MTQEKERLWNTGWEKKAKPVQQELILTFLVIINKLPSEGTCSLKTIMSRDGRRQQTCTVGGAKTKDEYDTVIGGLRSNLTVRVIQWRRQFQPHNPGCVGTFFRLFFDTLIFIHDFIRLIFLDGHREASVLGNELPEESDQFRFLRTVCFANLKGDVGLNMTKKSDMWTSIPLDLSSRSFMPLPRFLRSCRPTPFFAPTLGLFSPCSYLSGTCWVFILAFVLLCAPYISVSPSFPVVYYESLKWELKTKNCIWISVWWKTRN